MWVQNYN